MSEEVADNVTMSPLCASRPLDPLDEWITQNRENYTKDIHTLVLAAKFNDVEVR